MYIVYSKEGCVNCERAKALLLSRGIEYEERMAGVDYELGYLRGLGVRQLPHIRKYIEDDWEKVVGGLEELKKELF